MTYELPKILPPYEDLVFKKLIPTSE